MLYPMRFTGPSTWRSSEESALPRASIETRPLLSYRQIVQGPTSLAMRLRRRSQRLCEPQIPSMINVCVESFRLSGLLSAGDPDKLETIRIAPVHAQRLVRTAHSSRFLVVERLTTAGIYASFSVCTAAGPVDSGGPTSLMCNCEIFSPGSVIAQARDTSIFQIASRTCMRSVGV